MTQLSLFSFVTRSGMLALAAAAAIAGCSSRGYDDPCPSYKTTCGTVCDNYCDSWGCRPYCYDSCWDECASPGYPGTGARPDAGSEGGVADAGSLLCSPCATHSDCGAGNKCLALAPASGSASSGVCGVACGTSADCPATYECIAVESTKQCVPIARKCEAPKPPPAAQCGPDKACVTGFQCVDGLCAQSCSSTTACATGEVCLDGKYCAAYAAKSCTADTSCAAAERCGATGKCTPICLDARDCPKGWACGEGGLCAPPAAVDGGAPVDAGPVDAATD